MAVAETISAAAKLGRKDALQLAAKASEIVVAKGTKVSRFSRRSRPDDSTLLAHLLGPTGNLRAPTIITGKTMLVGFNEDVYDEVFST